MECPKCEFENPDGFKFCGECTHPLTDQIEVSPMGAVTESERKHVTIMFSDLSGYTALNEKLDPEEVKEIMSQIFGEVTRIIKKYDGFIERFIGDAVMAVFGIPLAHEDDPVRAIRAAMEILAIVESISPQFEKKIGRSLTMHIGINTGLVVTGEVDVQKGTHGLTGDAINLASRLESIAGAGEIIVGPDTYHQAASWFEFEALEATQVKGKTNPVEVYRVVSILEQQATIRRNHGVQAELVGRDAEMAMLMEAVENLKQRRGSVISIAGYAGTGKSRLIQEFKDQLSPGEIQWHEGHAYAYSQNTAYYPLTNLFARAFQIREEDRPEQIREKIETSVQTLLWDKPEAKQYLGSLFSLGYSEIDGVSPEYWRDRLQKSVQLLLEAVAGRGPTVILFEDLHWADGAFIELLHLLLRNLQRPVMFLCIYRPVFSLFPDGEPEAFAWPHYKIYLRDLSWDKTEEMLQSLLNSTDLPDDLRYFIREKVEGNPFYLEEVINTLIETGTLVPDDGSWQLSGSLDLKDIPTSIQGVLTARLDRLEKQTKRILQEASVIGRAFFYKVLTRITELTQAVDEHLSGLESLDLIRARSREPDLEYIFKHALTQEVAYNGLLKKERQKIHERIGLAIEQLFSERLTDFYEILAFHFKQGISKSKAIEYLMKSGKKSFSRCDSAEAHQFYEEAYALLSQELSENRQRDELIIELLNEWGLVFIWRGETERFIHLLKKNESVAESIEDKEKKGLFFSELGIALCQREQDEKSYPYLKKALELGEASGSPKATGYALFRLSLTCVNLGYLDEAVRYGERACQLSQDPCAELPLHRAATGLLNAYWVKGDIKKLREFGGRFNDKEEKSLDHRHRVMGNLLLGAAEINSGNFAKAIKFFASAVEDSLDPYLIQTSTLYLGYAYLADEQFNEALSISEEVMKFTEKYGFDSYGSIAMSFRGFALISTGNLHDGLRYIGKAMGRWQKAKRRYTIAVAHIFYGQVYLSIVEGKKPLSVIFILNNLIPLIKLIPGAFKKAVGHFNEAIKISKEIGALGLRGQAHLGLARLNRAKNRDEEARNSILTAISIFETIEADGFLQQAKDVFQSLQQ